MSEAELQFIRDNAHLLTDEGLAAAMTRVCGRKVHVDAVETARRRMKLRKRGGRGSKLLNYETEGLDDLLSD
jgi:hypothetical protein